MNPEGKNWDKILKKYGIDGINFRNGEPDFRSISKGDVKIKEFSSARTDNYKEIVLSAFQPTLNVISPNISCLIC